MRRMKDLFGRSKPGAGKTRKRRRAPPRWLRPLVLGFLVAAALGAVIGGPVWLWQAGYVAKAAAAARDHLIAKSLEAGFAIDNVLLEGRHYASRRRIAQTVGLRRGAPIFGFSPRDVRARLVALPWIRDASVERRLPDTVRIRLVERRPMALWQRRGRLSLVDDWGTVIPGVPLQRFRHLIILIGKDAPREAPTLFAMLAAQPALADRVIAATRVGSRRWTLKLTGGVKVRLPEVDPHVAWARLAAMQARHRLFDRDVTLIDLRFPDRLIVRPGAFGAQTIGGKGRNT